ncbi:hypothetical protein PHJA_000316400 [Phtheirospermum japonicum]|uniref:Secreted protein n=1 Tax=Phtheirospermum japonicum TaxID=374723 RepID=A0A830BI67_9LAMI|nr:hypothetical protein PHJA_000316400 [Phtheirospermum japonicum]
MGFRSGLIGLCSSLLLVARFLGVLSDSGCGMRFRTMEMVAWMKFLFWNPRVPAFSGDVGSDLTLVQN